MSDGAFAALITACIIFPLGFWVGQWYTRSIITQVASELYKCIDKDGETFIDEEWKDDLDSDDEDMDFLHDEDWWKRKK
jgi:hypothetical protein